MDFYDEQEQDLMDEVRRLHIQFVEASQKACAALGQLLNELDRNGSAPDIQIERRHGSNVLAAYIQADEAFQNLECYFPNENDK